MTLITPTLRTIRARVRDDVTARLPGADASVPNTNLRVLAEMVAGVGLDLHAYLQWLGKQLLPDQAEDDWLIRHANIWLRRGIRAATFCGATAALTGTAGTVIPAGTVLLFGSYAYETTGILTLGSGPTEVAIEAVTAGAAPSVAVGSTLRLQSAIAGVTPTATVTAATAGIDEETIDELRERVLERIRTPPMGGAKADYIAWMKEVPGVTRAWCSPREMGTGTVTLRFMMDDLRADLDGFPTSDDLATVAAYIDGVRPVTVLDRFVVAPIAEPIDMTISNLATDSSAVRAAIAASVADMLKRRAAPGQTIWASWASEAISIATGEDHHDLTFADHPMPTLGHIAVPGVITYA